MLLIIIFQFCKIVIILNSLQSSGLFSYDGPVFWLILCKQCLAFSKK